MTYQEYRTKQQNEVNKLPIFFAFSESQLQKALDDRNATTDDIYSMKGFSGAFYLKKDAQVIADYVNRPDPIDELIKDPEFAYEAFAYELRNHEYCYNHYQGDWDTLTSIFGNMPYKNNYSYINYLQYVNHPELIPIYKKAVTDYYRWCDEHDVW